MALNEQLRAAPADTESAMDAYSAKFPEDEADWMHPSLVGTAQLVEALREAVSRQAPLTVEEVERRFGPLSWEW